MANTYIFTLTNPGAEFGNTSGWTSNGNFRVRTSTPVPYEGSYYFLAGNVASTWARQDIDITNDSANNDIDANIAMANISWWQAGLGSGDTDSGTIQLRFMNGASFLANTTLSQSTYDQTWKHNQNGFKIPYKTRKIRVEMVATRASGTNTDVYFDNISSLYINAGNFVDVNVDTLYVEATTDYGFNYSTGVNVDTLYVEATTDVPYTSNANVSQMFVEIIIGGRIPKVMVA